MPAPPHRQPEDPSEDSGRCEAAENQLCPDGGNATARNCPHGEDALACLSPHVPHAAAGEGALEKAFPDQKLKLQRHMEGNEYFSANTMSHLFHFLQLIKFPAIVITVVYR